MKRVLIPRKRLHAGQGSLLVGLLAESQGLLMLTLGHLQGVVDREDLLEVVVEVVGLRAITKRVKGNREWCTACQCRGVLLIDAANVVGCRPDGWWRDRPKAAARLIDAVRVATAASRLPRPVVVVLEGAARNGAEEADDIDVAVVHAPAAGDETLVEIAAAAAEAVMLVSADRALRARCQALGADVVGPSWLLDRLGS